VPVPVEILYRFNSSSTVPLDKEEKRKVESYEDALNYMLDNFLAAVDPQKNSIFFIFDEIEVYSKLKHIMDRIEGLDKVTVTITHNNDNLNKFSAKRQINFTKVSRDITSITC